MPTQASGGLLALAACVALLVDRWWGEPPVAVHPVVWMGRLLGAMGWCIAPAAHPPSARVTSVTGSALGPQAVWPFVWGALAWSAGALLVGGLAVGVQSVLLQGALVHWLDSHAGGLVLGAIQVLLLGLLLKPLLAWRMLRDEVATVETALSQSLAQGRERLSWLCSRDVNQLSAEQVRETALETLAENLNDSVIAPLFWFVLLGLPGAAVYRWANTADAMWGYLGERQGRDWTWAGKWAARADDVLSYLPARLTGGLLMLVARSRAWGAWLQQARITPSPNGGWPMAALALGLGVRLGKPSVYVLNPQGRPPSAQDTALALQRAQLCVRVVGGGLLLAAGLAWAHPVGVGL